MTPSPGRPAGRKPLLNLRIPAPLLASLEAAARKNGRTVAEEATRRLERSFDRDELRRLIRESL